MDGDDGMITQVQYDGITLNQCGPGSSWRLAHDGVKVITMPFESDGVTGTRYVLFEAVTEAECLAEIARLGLTVPEEVPGA
jgi:hypothetical protein